MGRVWNADCGGGGGGGGGDDDDCGEQICGALRTRREVLRRVIRRVGVWSWVWI